MTLTVRSATVTGATTKGSALTHAELDENFNHLSQSSNHTFTPSGIAQANAASRTVAAKLSEAVLSVTDSKNDDGTQVAGDGSQDDTTGIQRAIDTGRPVYFPPGTYKITSTLNLTTAAAHGQTIYGAKAAAVDGNGDPVGTNRTVIKPSSAVSVGFKVDGSGISLAIQNFRFRDFTVDMDDMTDASTRIAFRQMSAYGAQYDNVHVVNDGTNKRAWKFETGSFTTALRSCRGKVIQCAGTDLSSAVTTLLLDHCDFQEFVGDALVGLTVRAGTVQGTRNKFTLSVCRAVEIRGIDIEGTGTAFVYGTNVDHFHSGANGWVGFSGTYESGTVPATGTWADDYGTGVYRFNKATVTINGTLNTKSSAAALLRTLIENTNVTSQQVDTQYKNANGSVYFGINAAGDLTADARGTGKGKLTSTDIEAVQWNQDTGAAELGFYGTTAIPKQTGVAVTAEGIHAALVALGLIAA